MLTGGTNATDSKSTEAKECSEVSSFNPYSNTNTSFKSKDTSTPFETLKLKTDSGSTLDFKVYQEANIPFFQNSTTAAILRKNIIDGDMDDDCATDEEQRKSAKGMLNRELNHAVTTYLREKADGTQASFVNNLNLPKQ